MAKDLFEEALAAEGITGPLADLARSVYQQESSSGKNAKTSNAGAVGGMQIRPGTFREVAGKDWDINDPSHNARAGIRYLKKMHEKAGGDLELTAVGYYGGPGGIAKAKKGVAVSDPRNPKAPDTREYARQVVARMPNQEVPIGTILGLPDDQMQQYKRPSDIDLQNMFTDNESPFKLNGTRADINSFYDRPVPGRFGGRSVSPGDAVAQLQGADPQMSIRPDMSVPPELAQVAAAEQMGAIQATAVENPWKAFQMLKASNLGSGMNYGVKANAPEVDFSKFGRFGERKA